MSTEPTTTASTTQPTVAGPTVAEPTVAEPTLTRRVLLATGVVAAGTAGVAALAGCSNGSPSSGTPGAGAAGAAGDPSPDSTAPGTVLAKVSDVPVGNALAATMGGKPILISQPAAGTILTFSAVCTHQGCTVAPAGKEFHCPCHGSVYDAATGAVLQGPAPAGLAKIPTHVSNGDVVSGA